MRALVTGAAGFIGRHVTTELGQRGYQVSRCDVALGWDAMNVFRQGAKDCIQHYDLVVHAAAVAPHRAAIDSQPASHLRNALLDAAMFDWALRTGQGRVLYFSSCAVLDAPATPLDDYGLLKANGERMAAQARAAGLPVTVVRPYSGYGEDQSTDFPFGAFVDRVRRRVDPFPLWRAGAVRDWIHVEDVVNGALAVVESGTASPVSLCTGIGTAAGEVAEMLCDAAGYRPRFEVQGDMPQGVPWRVGDPTELLRYYTPTITLAEGVKRALE